MPPKNKRGAPNVMAPVPTPPPNWPPFDPLVPESDLSLHEVLPNQIITVPSLWTSTLCKNYVSFLSSLPLTTTPGKPKKGHAVRVNDRFQIDDPVFAERLWSLTALKNLVLGINEEGGLGLMKDAQVKLWGGEVVNPPVFDHFVIALMMMQR
jgi:hypothetical protein